MKERARGEGAGEGRGRRCGHGRGRGRGRQGTWARARVRARFVLGGRGSCSDGGAVVVRFDSSAAVRLLELHRRPLAHRCLHERRAARSLESRLARGAADRLHGHGIASVVSRGRCTMSEEWHGVGARGAMCGWACTWGGGRARGLGWDGQAAERQEGRTRSATSPTSWCSVAAAVARVAPIARSVAHRRSSTRTAKRCVRALVAAPTLSNGRRSSGHAALQASYFMRRGSLSSLLTVRCRLSIALSSRPL